MALIFNVIKNLQSLNKEKKNNLRFLLSARQPEFDWALERNLFQDISLVQKIKSLFDNDYKSIVKYFEKEEVKEFIEKYRSYLNPVLKNKSIELNTDTIFKDTKGHPIMVRFAVLNEGLSGHIEQMYLEYLQDKSNYNYPHKQRLGVIILNSLFDISSISLKDELLDEFGLLKTAKELRNTIIKKSVDVWKTIHPKWDMELFKYMFSLEYSLDDIKNSFIEIVKDITSNEKISGLDKVHVLFIIYYIFIKKKVTEFDTIEKMISLEYIESKLDVESKVIFYTYVMSFSYSESGKIEEALNFINKALEINPKSDAAYLNKGVALSNLGKNEEADLGKKEEAIVEYDKALEINPRDVMIYDNKGYSLFLLGRIGDAIELSTRSIGLDENYANAWYNRSVYYSHDNKIEESLLDLQKAIAIDISYRDYALKDKDLDNMRNNAKFMEILNLK